MSVQLTVILGADVSKSAGSHVRLDAGTARDYSIIFYLLGCGKQKVNLATLFGKTHSG